MRMSAGEVISSVVFGGAGLWFGLAALDPGRGGAERVVLGLCALGTAAAALRFHIAGALAHLRRR